MVVFRFIDYAGVVFGLRQSQPHGDDWGCGVSGQRKCNITGWNDVGALVHVI